MQTTAKQCQGVLFCLLWLVYGLECLFVDYDQIVFLRIFAVLRSAYKMKIKSGSEAEYKKRHDEIWPELSEELTNAGVSDYSIFLDEETLTLFAVWRLTEDNTADQLPQTEIVKKWWAYMSDIMETNPDNSPMAVGLPEVFYME